MKRQGEIQKKSIRLFLILLILGVYFAGCRRRVPEITICELQGSGLISPYFGQEVAVSGVITADLLDQAPAGFTLQDVSCQNQAIAGSSGGIFVLVESGYDQPKLGDLVTVQGLVVEHAQETYLVLRDCSIKVESVDNPIPAAIDLAGEINKVGPGMDYESWEAMRVKVSRALVVSNPDSLGGTWIYPELPYKNQFALTDFQVRQGLIRLAHRSGNSRISLAVPGDQLINLTGVLRQDGKEYVLQLLDPDAVSVTSGHNGTEIKISQVPDTETAIPGETLTPLDSPSPSPSITSYPVHLLLTEVFPNPTGDEPEGEWIELYNPEEYGLPLTGIKIGDEATRGGKEGMLRFPDGYFIEAKDVLVIAHNGAEFHANYGFYPDFEMVDSGSGVPDLLPYLSWGGSMVQFSNGGDEVVLLDPWDEVIDGLSYGKGWLSGFGSQVPSPKEGHSLERYPPEADHDQASDWREREKGSPGRLDRTSPTLEATETPRPIPTHTPSPLPSLTAAPEIPSPTPIRIQLLLSEIMFNPVGSEPEGEWFEIYNPAQEVMPLRGVKVGDAANQGDPEGMWVFPEDAELPPGEIIVVASRGDYFEMNYGEKPDYELQDSDPKVADLSHYPLWSSGLIRLGNQGDELLLLNGWDEITDCLVYGDSTSDLLQPAVEIVSEGSSLARFPINQDTDSALDWIQAEAPSPGEINPGFPTPNLTSTLTPTQFPSQTTTSSPMPSPTSTATSQPTTSPSQTSSPISTILPTDTPVSTQPIPSQTNSQVPQLSPTTSHTSIPTPTKTPIISPTQTFTVIPGTTTPTPSPSPSNIPNTPTLSPTEITCTPTLIAADASLVINEIHADPHSEWGDANRDGKVDSDDDEFIEIVNRSEDGLEISGWEIQDAVRIRFQFPAGTILESNQAVLVFGGGEPNGDFGGSIIFTTGTLGLNNTGDTLRILDQNNTLRLQLSYGREGNQNQSLTRYPDLVGAGPLIPHSEIPQAGGALFSPGVKVNGETFRE